MTKHTRFTSECVYSILRSDRLAAIYKSSRKGRITEGKPWTRAKRLVEAARRDGLCVPILFAKAEKCDTLVYWGIISSVKIRSGRELHRKSVVNVIEIRRFKAPRPRKTDLVVASSGKRIPQSHNRPYVLCRTPRFLVPHSGTHAAVKRGPKPDRTRKCAVEDLGREALNIAHDLYSEGDNCPFALFTEMDGRKHLVRLPTASGIIDAEHIDTCRNLVANLAGPNPHAIVFDGYVTGGRGKQDAMVCQVTDPRRKTAICLAQRYRHQAGTCGIGRIGRVIVLK